MVGRIFVSRNRTGFGSAICISFAVLVSCGAVPLCARPAPTETTGDAAAGRPNATRGVLILRAQAVSNAVEPPPPAPAPVTQGTGQPVPPNCLRPFKRPDLATGVGNGARFDRLLARQLRATPATLVVDVATPWKVDTPPPAPLDRWMGQLSANGGQVTRAEYCGRTRGFLSMLSRMFAPRQDDRLAAINGYDAALQIDVATQTITQVQLLRRAAN